MLQLLYVFALAIFVFTAMEIYMGECFPICWCPLNLLYTLEMMTPLFLEVTPHRSPKLWSTVCTILTVLKGLSLFYLVLIQNLCEFASVPFTQSSLRDGKETGLG